MLVESKHRASSLLPRLARSYENQNFLAELQPKRVARCFKESPVVDFGAFLMLLSHSSFTYLLGCCLEKSTDFAHGEKGEKIARISHARLASHSSHLTTATHSGMREKFTPGNREAQRRDGDASGPSHRGISRTAEKRNLRLAVTSSRLAPQTSKCDQVPRHQPSTSPSRRPSLTPVRLPLVLSIRAVTAASKLRSSPVLLWCA